MFICGLKHSITELIDIPHSARLVKEEYLGAWLLLRISVLLTYMSKKDDIPDNLKPYTVKPKSEGKDKKKGIDNYVLPMKGGRVHVSENIDKILYNK